MNAPVRLGDQVRDGSTPGIGTVYDLFEHDGQQYAQIEWTARGNQYTPSRSFCKAKPVSLLTVANTTARRSPA